MRRWERVQVGVEKDRRRERSHPLTRLCWGRKCQQAALWKELVKPWGRTFFSRQQKPPTELKSRA